MLDSFGVKWLKHLMCPELQICSHRHGEQAVRHAAWWLHGHRPAAHKEGDETDQVEWMGWAKAATEKQNDLFAKNHFSALSRGFKCETCMFVFPDLNVTRSVPLWRETGVWQRPCRSTLPPTPSTSALLPYTATASRRMPGLSLYISWSFISFVCAICSFQLLMRLPVASFISERIWNL